MGGGGYWGVVGEPMSSGFRSVVLQLLYTALSM